MAEQLTHGAAADRRRRLLGIVQSDGFASVATLSMAFGVSQMTVRRDLQRLAAEGEVRLVHGGATAGPTISAAHTVGPADGSGPADAAAHDADGRDEAPTPPFSDRQRTAARAKQRIGRTAARLIQPGTTVGIDAGTTALEVVRHLPSRFDGVVVTHSVPVLAELLGRPAPRVIGIGGELLPESRAMVGGQAAEQLRGLRLRLLMLGAGAVDAGGIYVRSQVELEAKRALLEIADEVVLVTDARKLTASAPVRVCGLDRIDTWVVDRPLPTELAVAARRNGSRVVIADA